MDTIIVVVAAAAFTRHALVKTLESTMEDSMRRKRRNAVHRAVFQAGLNANSGEPTFSHANPNAPHFQEVGGGRWRRWQYNHPSHHSCRN